MEREDIKNLLDKTFAGELLGESGSYKEGMDELIDLILKLKNNDR